MKKLGIFVALVLAVLVGFKAAPAFASAFASASDKLTTVAKEQVVDGAVYLAGETVAVAGTVKGDVYCAGRNVTVSGTVEGDVLCAGQDVTIEGTVKGDVRAAGATVLLKGAVEGSVSFMGATITTDSASKIGRDAFVAANSVNLSGTVGRDAMLGGSRVVLSGVVGRDVSGQVTTLQAAQTAKIGGNLTYVSDYDASVPGGVVAGKVQRTPIAEHEGRFGRSSNTISGLLLAALVAVLLFVALTLLVVLILPKYAHRVSDVSNAKQFAIYFLIGLASVVVTPVLIMLLMISVIGIYAALALGVAFVLALIVGGPLVAYRFGRFMLSDTQGKLAAALVGATVLGILGIVPFIGWMIMFVSVVAGLGMVILGLKPEYAPETLPVVAPKKDVRKSTKQK